MSDAPNKQKPFSDEKALCRRFIEALPKGWTPYAETCGWDILLVRRSDGFQIGVQAKLKLNAGVINQAIEDGNSYWVTSPGPDCRAVMVPYGGASRLAQIAAHIGLTVIEVRTPYPKHVFGPDFTPSLPEETRYWGWFELCPTRRHTLPEYIPDVDAGDSAPLQLTQWKIRAIKIAVLLERRGYLIRQDFKHLDIDHRRWLSQGWLRPNDGHWIADTLPDFKAQHPRVYAEIAADFEKWKPAEALP